MINKVQSKNWKNFTVSGANMNCISDIVKSDHMVNVNILYNVYHAMILINVYYTCIQGQVECLGDSQWECELAS